MCPTRCHAFLLLLPSTCSFGSGVLLYSYALLLLCGAASFRLSFVVLLTLCSLPLLSTTPAFAGTFPPLHPGNSTRFSRFLSHLQGGRLALILLGPLQNSEWAPVGPTFRIGMGPWENLLGPHRRTGSTHGSFFHGVCCLVGVEKTWNLDNTKIK